MSCPRVRSCQGFTLLEVMVSLVIFSLASVAMAKSFVTQLTTNSTSERRSAAVEAAQNVLDQLRVVDPATMPSAAGASSTQNVTIGSRTFAVKAIYCKSASYCNSNNIRQITIEVRFKGVLQYTVETIYAQLR